MRTTGIRLAGLVAFAALAVSVGCTVSSNTVDTEYEDCVFGDACTDDTACEATEFASGVGTGSMCTTHCQANGDCAPDSFGRPVVCVILAGNPDGQCYVDCTTDPGLCKAGTQCATPGGDQVLICVP